MNILYLLMTVLKFIGIIILIILITLLIIIISVLIIPIEYQVYINKQDSIYAKTDMRWLYSIMALEIIYDQDQIVHKTLKIFGKKVFPFKRKQVRQPKEYKQSAKPPKPVKQVKEKQRTNVNKTIKPSKHVKDKEKPKKKKTKSKNLLNNILDFKYKRELLEDTIEWIGKVLREIMPSKFFLSLEIGKDDPADTGQLIGMLAVLYPFYYSNINITGNYEKECFYGILKARGGFTLGKILYDFIKYVRKMSVGQMIKFIRQGRREKKHGRKVTN